ncbi:hypothetical protein MFKK_02350 [Halopseudomonas aestusnigri]|nr:hypothetical protein MFKK_02350 [Halopseudomonas aestusnigri]
MDICRIVLPVSVHKDDYVTTRSSCAGFDRCAITFTVRMTRHNTACRFRDCGRFIVGPIIYYDYFPPLTNSTELLK